MRCFGEGGESGLSVAKRLPCFSAERRWRSFIQSVPFQESGWVRLGGIYDGIKEQTCHVHVLFWKPHG